MKVKGHSRKKESFEQPKNTKEDTLNATRTGIIPNKQIDSVAVGISKRKGGSRAEC